MTAAPRWVPRYLGRAALVAAIAVPLAVAAPAAAAPPPVPTAQGEEAPPIRVEPAAAQDRSDAAAALVTAMSTRERAAAIVMAHTPTTDPGAAADFVAQTGIAGFILMGANIGADEAAVRDLTDALTLDAALPPLIAVDQEGGDVRRLRWDDFPASTTLKRTDAVATLDAFAARGSLLGRVGIGVNFGVVADYTDDPGSFIYRRSLGTDAAGSAERVAAAVEGESPFAASTLKHFPGHGATPGDSHRVIPATDMSLEAWRSGEAVPFREGVAAGAELVMFGHLAYTAVDAAPASLSAAWHDILRDELGFTGVAVTDDMAMLEASGIPAYADPVENAIAAVVAGNDLVLGVAYTTPGRVTAVVDGIVQATESGRIAPERLQEAATRVTALRLARGGSSGAVPCGECAPVG